MPIRTPFTKRRLRALLLRQQQFLLNYGADGHWQLFPERPWFRFSAPAPVPAWLEQADLTGLDLRGVDLRCANLRLVVCHGQDLSGARLDGALLRDGGFVGTRFCGASLRRVDCTAARFARCDFTGADLQGAEFENADLNGARIDWAQVGRGRFRVAYVEGCATGGYGELEQDYAWVVTDQQTMREVARFEGHAYRCLFSSDPTSYSGAVAVRVAEDARTLQVSFDSGAVEIRNLPWD